MWCAADRHIHFDQEEWFFVIEGGEVAMEIGDLKMTLKPGDSVLAPRNVLHVWAYLGDRPGRMLFAFTPGRRKPKTSSFRRECLTPSSATSGYSKHTA